MDGLAKLVRAEPVWRCSRGMGIDGLEIALFGQKRLVDLRAIWDNSGLAVLIE